MANLDTRSFSAIVQSMAAAMQAKATALIDLSVGSILRSAIEAVAGVALWLEGLIIQVISVTRLSTSTGSDVDSYVNDFGLTRAGSNASTGLVTFSRYTATDQAIVPIGAQVKTSTGIAFNVIADTTNSAYSSALGGYVLSAGVSSLAVPVQAQVPALASNVTAGSISILSTSITGIDTVSNASSFSGGADSESENHRFPRRGR